MIGSPMLGMPLTRIFRYENLDRLVKQFFFERSRRFTDLRIADLNLPVAIHQH